MVQTETATLRTRKFMTNRLLQRRQMVGALFAQQLVLLLHVLTSSIRAGLYVNEYNVLGEYNSPCSLLFPCNVIVTGGNAH